MTFTHSNTTFSVGDRVKAKLDIWDNDYPGVIKEVDHNAGLFTIDLIFEPDTEPAQYIWAFDGFSNIGDSFSMEKA